MEVKNVKGDKFLLWPFLIGLFLLPLVFWPKATIPYEIPKVWFILRWIELLGILGIIVGLRNLEKRTPDNILIVLILVFSLVAFFSSLLGVDFLKSFWGNYFRLDGLFTLFHLVAFLFFLILFWDNSWINPTAQMISLGSLATTLVTIIDGFRYYALKDWRAVWPDGAIGATFGQPNFLAGYLLVCLPFLGFLADQSFKRKAKFFWSLAIVSQILGIFLTFSKAGVMGAILFSVIRPLFKKPVIKPSVLIIPILGLFFLASYLLYKDSLRTNRRNPQDYFPESRRRILVKGLLSFSKKPLLGWGWVNFDYAFKSVDWPLKVEQDVWVDKAHSHFLEILVTTGLVGFSFYFLLILKIVLKFWRAINQKGKDQFWLRTIFLVFILFVWHSQTNIVSISEELMFWLVTGILGTKAD
jgi:O-antigen ligase